MLINQSPPEVAVIGAGVSGLVAARRLSAEGFNVTIYERRTQTGGVWNYTETPDSEDGLLMGAWNRWDGNADRQSNFASAVYDDLQTNFPRQLMELQDCPWRDQPLFMSHRLVRQYLADYARQMPSNVQFRGGKEVVDLYHCPTMGCWKLTFRDVPTQALFAQDYAAVVVAVGVYDKIFVPKLEGLQAWDQKWPDTLSHSKFYRNPEKFRGKKVVIVGYGASGFDIANKISSHVARLWVSTADESAQLPAGAERVPSLTQLHPFRRRLHFEQGKKLMGVDCVIFCTGYSYSQSFIRADNTSNQPLFPDGQVIPDLHEHVLYIPKPSLAFIGLIKGAVPTFLIVQAQAAFLSRVWAGRDPRLSISLSEGRIGCPDQAEHKELACHELPYPKFMECLLRLERTCDEVDGKQTRFAANLAYRWTLEHEWILQHRREIRTKFFTNNPQQRRYINSMTKLYRAPDEFQGFTLLLSRRHEDTTLFAILYAGYFPDGREISDILPSDRLSLEGPERYKYVRCLDPKPLAKVLSSKELWSDYWRKLGNAKSRAMFISGARNLVRLCRQQSEDVMRQIEPRLKFRRPGLETGSTHQDDLWRFHKHLAFQKQICVDLDIKLSKITQFRDHEIEE